jgi:hypothetical protein
MISVLGENYFVDLDEIEKFLDMDEIDTTTTGSTEMRINIIKFELVKMLLDTILTEQEAIDEQLGLKKNLNVSIPFRLAFNTLLNKKLINHY